MTKMQWLLLTIIIVSVGVLVSASQDFSTYGDFNSAVESKNPVKVVGTLSKARPMVYDPATDPNYFSFYMLDNQGKEAQVVLRTAKPTDFERSEQIVLTGQFNGEVFEASDMLMKCPSKYKEEEIYIKSKEI